MKALTLVAMAAAKIPLGEHRCATEARIEPMGRSRRRETLSRKSISRTLQSSVGADLQIAETRKIEMRMSKINGKFVS